MLIVRLFPFSRRRSKTASLGLHGREKYRDSALLTALLPARGVAFVLPIRPYEATRSCLPCATQRIDHWWLELAERWRADHRTGARAGGPGGTREGGPGPGHPALKKAYELMSKVASISHNRVHSAIRVFSAKDQLPILDLDINLRGAHTSTKVDIAPSGLLSMPLDEAIYADIADFVTNNKKVCISADIALVPTLPAEAMTYVGAGRIGGAGMPRGRVGRGRRDRFRARFKAGRVWAGGAGQDKSRHQMCTELYMRSKLGIGMHHVRIAALVSRRIGGKGLPGSPHIRHQGQLAQVPAMAGRNVAALRLITA